MSSAEVRRRIDRVTARWVADAGGGVVWAGDHEGRRGVRLEQRGRDFTTLWFVVGERTVAIEAYVFSAPPPGETGGGLSPMPGAQHVGAAAALRP